MPFSKGSCHSLESREKMSAARRGKRHSPKTLAKMSASQQGHSVSSEARLKIGAAHRGSRQSPETCAKIAASCRVCARRGDKHHNWNGGRYQDAEGYIRVLCHEHPLADRDGYVMEHRLIMEAHLGRTLLPTEVVHHINGIKDDNRTENLQRFDSNNDHLGWHREAKP